MYRLITNLKNNTMIKLSILSLLLFFTSFAMALKKDIEKPVYISADSVVFNKSKGFAIYEGHVSIVQGTLKIKASKIQISAPRNKISKITATGAPVSFQQKMDDGKLAKGKANRVIYLVEEKRILFDGGAVMSQNNDKFSSNHIEYSIRTGELKAGNKKKSGTSRVKAVFYPSNRVK